MTQAPQSHAPATQFGTNTEVPQYNSQAGPSQGASQPAPPQSRQPQQQQQYHTPQPPQPTPAPTVSLTSQGSGQVRGQPRGNQGSQGPSVPQQAPETSTAPQSAQTTATQAAQAAAAAAIAKPARPSSFLQAAGGSAPAEGSRGPQPGRGGASGAGGGRGRGRAPPRAPPVTVPNEDFDFEEMMKKFNKQAALKAPTAQPYASKVLDDFKGSEGEMRKTDCFGETRLVPLEAESKPEQPKPAEKPTFEDDFFDSISSDATERLAREDGRGRFAEQRKIDMETFGGAGMARRHQGGRGGYRGGRGQQQGQGQGQSQGYQNGPARGPGQGQSYQNGPARGQGQGYQNGPARGRGQGYQNGPGRGEGAQGGRGTGGFQTVPSRGGYRGGGRGGNGPRAHWSDLLLALDLPNCAIGNGKLALRALLSFVVALLPREQLGKSLLALEQLI
ncbi:MAG: hypothetical protein FRX49_05358 [Trebouxia sp. A1-2]|nr:MAG: hypothetical protein FRX49_05358 [Trebouxia sp. A1-2]